MDEVLLHISFSLKEVLEFKPIEDAVTPKRSVQSGSQHSLDHVDSSIRDYIATASRGEAARRKRVAISIRSRLHACCQAETRRDATLVCRNGTSVAVAVLLPEEALLGHK
jgi:hypothetical protein